jgi:hypothetical protein
MGQLDLAVDEFFAGDEPVRFIVDGAKIGVAIFEFVRRERRDKPERQAHPAVSQKIARAIGVGVHIGSFSQWPR